MIKAMHTADEQAFVHEILHCTEGCAKRSWDGSAEWYMIRVIHDRHDTTPELACRSGPDLKGKIIESSFAASILFRNYTGKLDRLPKIVALRSVDDLKRWASSIDPEKAGVPPFTMTPGLGYQDDKPHGYTCHCEYQDEREAIAAAVAQINWDTAHVDTYACVPYDGTDANPGGTPGGESTPHLMPAFSPALNSLSVVREKPGGRVLLWCGQGATGSGQATSGYFGTEIDKPIYSRAGTTFIETADTMNIYKMTLSDDPLTLKIEVIYKNLQQGGPDAVNTVTRDDIREGRAFPHISITSIFEPATEEQVRAHHAAWFGHGALANFIVKGTIALETIRVYNPSANVKWAMFMNEDPTGARTLLEEARKRSKDCEEGFPIGQLPLSKGDREKYQIASLVGPLLDIVHRYCAWRHAIWIVPPQCKDNEDAEAVPFIPQKETPPSWGECPMNRDEARAWLARWQPTCPHLEQQHRQRGLPSVEPHVP